MTKSKFLLLTFCALIFVFIVYVFFPPRPPISPLSSLPHQPSAISHQTYVILGFLPYWNLKKFSPEAANSITHLAYFTLHLDSAGNLVKLDRPGEQDPGYTNYRRILESEYSNLVLTFMPYDQEALGDILSSHQTRLQAVSTITSRLKESGSVGVNIDFEPVGTVSPTLRDNFTLFISELSQSLAIDPLRSEASHQSLSISIYPSAAARPRLWDLSALAPFTNHFVVMTYDYHLPGSLKSGPNSPLRGAGQLFEYDILTNLAEITKLVSPAQILLGIPFYGYEWTTDSGEKYSPTLERASVASLERIEELIKEQTLELLWDRNSLTPYAIRREEGEIISQIYYESVDSIRLKLDLVKQAGLGGIAIWALGYEGNNPSLWSTIRSLNE